MSVLMKNVHEVLSMTTEGLVKAAAKHLLGYYPTAFLNGDHFIYAVGESPICLVAHMDTVRDPQVDPKDTFKRHASHVGKGYELVQFRNILRNRTGVLGADDRAGVFGIFEILRRCKAEKLPLPSVILTNGEESGGKGVKVMLACNSFGKRDEGRTRLFVEMDRQGCNEWVTYGATLPKPVIEYVESFGFVSGRGSYSDIADLQEEYLIPAVNLSIGYYSQHSDSERLHLDEMHTTINRVFGMIKDPIAELHPVAKKPQYATYYSGRRGSYLDEADFYGSYTRQPTSVLPAVTKPLAAAQPTLPMVSPARAKDDVPAPVNVWVEKTGDDDIDKVLEDITQGGYCTECGFPWDDCDVDCANIMISLGLRLTEDKLKYLSANYVDKDSPIKGQIDTYLVDSAELAKDVTPASTDPFHVDADGAGLVAAI